MNVVLKIWVERRGWHWTCFGSCSAQGAVHTTHCGIGCGNSIHINIISRTIKFRLRIPARSFCEISFKLRMTLRIAGSRGSFLKHKNF